MWEGEHLGRPVAVKVLRVYSAGEIEQIARVSLGGLTKMIRRSLDADRL